MGDRTRVDLLAELATKEIDQLNSKLDLLERTIRVMQEAMINMEIVINTYAGDIHAKKPKPRVKKD